jgi:hypothetical protein
MINHKEITTVDCHGPDNAMTEAVQATVEPGPSPRAVSCPFIITIESTNADGTVRISACKPAVMIRLRGEKQQELSQTQVRGVQCVHAYPVRQ